MSEIHTCTNMARPSSTAADSASDELIFTRPRGPLQGPTRFLYAMNCGPEAGVPLELIVSIFSDFGIVEKILPAGDNGTRVFIVFSEPSAAEAAKEALDQQPCARAGGKVMRIEYAALKERHKEIHLPVMMSGQEMGIPGLAFYPNFVSPKEEEEMLGAVDQQPWNLLSKRRVQHYGYEFQYKRKTVDPEAPLGELPGFVQAVVKRIEAIPELQTAEPPCLPLDQLTVNEYLRGVGLSPHIDTHTAFGGAVMSLSLGSPCIMQFRRPKECSQTPLPHTPRHPPYNATTLSASGAANGSSERYQTEPMEASDSLELRNGNGGAAEGGEDLGEDGGETFEKKAIFLPRGSLLVLQGEARYAWSHYIPHHKLDIVNRATIQRGRRVSLTFRKVRHGPCVCPFPESCDGRVWPPPAPSEGHRSGSGEEAASPARPSTKEDSLGSASEGLGASSDREAADGGATSAAAGQEAPPGECQVSRSPGTILEGRAGGSTSLERESEEGSRVWEVEEGIAGERGKEGAGHEDRINSGREAEGSGSRGTEGEGHLQAPEIERTYVHKVYDAIAPHFSSTRFAKWPKVAAFLHSLPAGSVVLDAGCGNGKYLGFNPNCLFVGCDISPALVAICAKHGFEVGVADALHLPYRDNSFDAGISIAVLHHLSSDQRRRRAISELVRVVRRGSKMLFTVWAREQEDSSLLAKWTPLSGRHTERWVEDALEPDRESSSSGKADHMGSIREDSQGENDIWLSRDQYGPSSDTGNDKLAGRSPGKPDGGPALVDMGANEERRSSDAESTQQEYFVPWHLPYHRAEIGGASAQAVAAGLARRDDKKGAVVYNRYYHVFTQGELERLAMEAGGTRIVDRFYDKSNWCIILEKL